MAMYSDRSRALLGRDAYLMGGAGAAADTQGAASVRGLIDPRDTPQATLGETMGLVHRGDQIVNAAQRELAGQMNAEENAMKQQYNAEEDARKEAKADWKWRVEQENKYGAGAPMSRFGEGASGFAGTGQDAYGNVMPGEQGGAMMSPSRKAFGGRTVSFDAPTHGGHAGVFGAPSFGGRAPVAPSFGGHYNQEMADTPEYFLPSYDVGTPYVPEDQVAMVHEGEAIIPAEQNPWGSQTRFRGGASQTRFRGPQPVMDAPPVAGIVESALRERAPGFRAPRWTPYQEASFGMRAEESNVDVARKRWEQQQREQSAANADYDPAVLSPQLAGLYDDYDVSSAWDDKGGLSGRGQVFRRGIDSGMDPKDAARAAGFSPREAKKAVEAQDNTELLNLYLPKNDDAAGQERAKALYADFIEQNGGDTTGLWSDTPAIDENGKKIPGKMKRFYEPAFEKYFMRFQRGIANKLSEAAAHQGAQVPMSKAWQEKQAAKAIEGAAATKKVIEEMQAAEDARVAEANAANAAEEQARRSRRNRISLGDPARARANGSLPVETPVVTPGKTSEQKWADQFKAAGGGSPVRYTTMAEYTPDQSEGAPMVRSGTQPLFAESGATLTPKMRRRFAAEAHPEYYQNERYYDSRRRDARPVTQQLAEGSAPVTAPKKWGGPLRWMDDAPTQDAAPKSQFYSPIPEGARPKPKPAEKQLYVRKRILEPYVADDGLASARKYVAENPDDPLAKEMQKNLELYDAAAQQATPPSKRYMNPLPKSKFDHPAVTQPRPVMTFGANDPTENLVGGFKRR